MEATAFHKTLELLSALNRHHVEYKVVGGIALIAQGIVRVTEDVDLFVNPSRENVARLKQALHDVWDDPAIDEISYEDLSGDYPAVAYGPPDGSLGVDILARLGEAFDYANVEAEYKQLGDIVVSVATPRMLHRMKRDTVRLKDRADAELLEDLYDLQKDP